MRIRRRRPKLQIPTVDWNADQQPSSGSIRIAHLSKTYLRGAGEVKALDDVSINIDRGQFVVLLGPSGSGKTTLLNLLGGIEPPSAGTAIVSGIDVSTLSGRALTDYRRSQVGFVFQFFNLVSTLTAMENVEVVAELTGPDAGLRARDALDEVGLEDRVDHFPGQLSGGEQQRVAIARALVKNAPLLLTDEPTGSLDLESGKQILSLLRRTTDMGRTVLVVTHNAAIATIADRVVELQDGRIESDRIVERPLSVAEVGW